MSAAECFTCSTAHGVETLMECIQCKTKIDYYSCAPGYCRDCAHDPRWQAVTITQPRRDETPEDAADRAISKWRRADPAKVRHHITINWLDETVARVLYGGEPTDYVIQKVGSHMVLAVKPTAVGSPIEVRQRYMTTDAILDRLANYWAGRTTAP